MEAPSTPSSSQALSLTDAYERIRRWYQANRDKNTGNNEEYRRRSFDLISALPPPEKVSPLEIRAVFEEVLNGLLEWGYRESDGDRRMFEYADEALATARLPRNLRPEEATELQRTSPLWRFLGRAQRGREADATQSRNPPPSSSATKGSAQRVMPSGDVGNAKPVTSVPNLSVSPVDLPPAATLHSDLWKGKPADDVLGFTLYAKSIAEFIDQGQTNPPLTIAVLAPWGRGKTTLMRLLREELAHKASHKPRASPAPAAPAPVTLFGRLLVRLRRATADKVAPPSPSPQPPPTPAPATPPPATTFGKLHDWLRGKIDLNPVKLSYPTVWFNAWKFQSTEQVWAGLANEIINQLVEQLPDQVEREKFWLMLQLRRVDTAAVLRDLRGVALERLAGQLLSWATLGIFVVLAVAAGLIVSAVDQARNVLSPGLTVSISAMAGTIGSFLLQAFRAHSDIEAKPLEGSYAKYVHQPDYAGQRGTFADIEEDIRLVFDLLVDEDNPAVVFIDDLDRCSPGKVAEVMEAMNLFLSGDFPKCYFVIGMDAQVVAASMDVAHKELTVKLAAVAQGYGSLGWYFMDKFIQLPFVIPSLTDDQRQAFLGNLFSQPQRPTPVSDALAKQAEQAINALKDPGQSGTSNLVQQAAQVIAPLHKEDPNRARAIAERALEAGARRFRDEDPEIADQFKQYVGYLGQAPRTLKRFANLYRFYRMVQWSRQLQGLDTAPAPALGRWLTLMLRWPQLVRWIQWEGEAQLFPQANNPARRAKEFEEGVLKAKTHAEWLDKHGLKSVNWCADDQLFEFLRATNDSNGPLLKALDQGVW